MYFIRCSIVADNSGDARDIFLDLCRLRGGGGERRQREGGDAARNLDSVGAGGDGHGLLRRPHLRRPLQPRCHPRFRLLQEVPLEAGTHER